MIANSSIGLVTILTLCTSLTLQSQLIGQGSTSESSPQLKSVVELQSPVPRGFVQPPTSLGPQNTFSPTSQIPKQTKSDWLFRMKDGSLVIGDLSEPITIKVNSRHGEFTVSSEDLVSLRMVASQVSDSDEKANDQVRQIVVATNSGDLFSGTCELQPVKIKLSWGDASINPSSIDFISFRDNSVVPKTITRSARDGQGWILTPVQIHHREHRIGNASYAVHVQSPGQLLTAPPKK